MESKVFSSVRGIRCPIYISRWLRYSKCGNDVFNARIRTKEGNSVRGTATRLSNGGWRFDAARPTTFFWWLLTKQLGN